MKKHHLAFAILIFGPAGGALAQSPDLVIVTKAREICEKLKESACIEERNVLQTVLNRAAQPPTAADTRLAQSALNVFSTCETRFVGECTQSIYEAFKK